MSEISACWCAMKSLFQGKKFNKKLSSTPKNEFQHVTLSQFISIDVMYQRDERSCGVKTSFQFKILCERLPQHKWKERERERE